MSPLVTFFWVLLVILLWVGVLAGVWMLVTASDEYSSEVSPGFADE